MENCVLQNQTDNSFWSTDRVREIISSHEVVVFGKSFKRCGITTAVEEHLIKAGIDYKKIDVGENKFVAAAVREHSGERLLPVVYVNGELVRQEDFGEIARLLSH